MVKSRRSKPIESFSLSLPPLFLIGLGLAASFFGLILFGPFDSTLLRRYCLGHPIAVSCVCLFFVGCVALVIKWTQALLQQQLTNKATSSLEQLAAEGADVSSSRRAQWLEANWQSLSTAIRDSWLGMRVRQIVEMQISRGRQHQLESDLKRTSEADGDRQHDSYSLVRIINWAMPMLGFLGTVLGISQTLGQLDTQKLATQQQDAMNELTAGLYVAFDTTAIALILTVVLMFIQFAVSRLELKQLSIIDTVCHRELIQFLGSDPYHAQENLLAPVREMCEQLTDSVESIVKQQAHLWAQTIAESRQQWQTQVDTSAAHIDEAMGNRIEHSLNQHAQQLTELAQAGEENADRRWQQWHTTLGNQARLMQDQQKEITLQCDYLQQLISSISDIPQLEEQIQASLERLENVQRLENASMCIGEAVAVLATSLERSGLIRGVPVRPTASGGIEKESKERGKAA